MHAGKKSASKINVKEKHINRNTTTLVVHTCPAGIFRET
jgi:ferredoxin-like protein FixX